MSIILIHPYPGRPEADVRLSGILSHALADREGRTIRTAEELDLRPGDRVLFALALDRWRGRAPWPTSASRPKTWAPT